MNLADITTKCYILALIIRDDDERLLLGDGAYEFKDSQQHFIANTYANDVVELQGTDGQMLAGQVRRTATQTFAGYIGDATFSKQKIEAARRDFLMFFRKKHYYTAVYVFSDGTAIQRDRGYIVNAPSVPELYQRFPEWSVGLNFEDPNYYEYAEDDLGQEIAAHKVELELSTAMSGGLIWDGDGAVSDDLSYVGTEIPGEGKNFQLADTGTATLKSAELLGDAEQTTYSGKNLFYFPTDTSGTSANITITCPVNSSSFTMNGTNNTGSNASKELVRNANPLTLSAGTYTIKIVGLKNNGGGLDYIYVMNASTSSVIKYVNPSNWTATFTLSESTPLSFGLIFSSTASYSNQTVTVQIESGSSATDYEPYVGGTASPNPDYPQEIETVTGEQTVNIAGKNLFDYASASNTANTTVTQYRVFAISGLEPNARYTISGQTAPQITDGNKFIYFWSASTYSGAERKVSLKSASTVTFDANADGIIYLAIYPTDEATWTSILSEHFTNAQLEKGNQTSSFEPYQGQEFEVNLGKNLFDGAIEQGGFDGSGLNVVVGNRVRSTNYIPVQPNTKYTIKGFSWDTTKGAVLGASISYYSVNDYTTARLSYQNWVSIGVEQGFTLTTPANCHYIRFLLTVGATAGGTTAVTPADIGEVQVELGSQATTYAPYFTPIELAKIGNYQDRIYKDSGKWYVEKQVGKVVLNGTENWTNQGGGAPYTIDMPDFDRYVNEVRAISDNFLGVKYNANWNEYSSLITSNSSSDPVARFKFRYTAITSLDAWKAWLASNPTTVYYTLATPTTTEITNIELIRQLERLRHSHTYANLTNFSITAASPNLPAFLKIVAFGDDAIPQGGYVWEDGGTGGATTITVDGVDNAQPIWTVVGPATNPSLTNITTGESIQWTGVVPNGQTLVVNMADMTASLSGANVFEFISGSWITLQAGNNRVSYSATAATGIATLEWNGVVG